MGSQSFSLPNELVRSAFKHHSVYFIRRESLPMKERVPKIHLYLVKKRLVGQNFLQVEQRLQFFPKSWDTWCGGWSTCFEQQSMGYKQADVSPLEEPLGCPNDAWAECSWYLKRQAKHWVLGCVNRGNSRDVGQNLAPYEEIKSHNQRRWIMKDNKGHTRSTLTAKDSLSTRNGK